MKPKAVSILLKVFATIIVLIVILVFFDQRLWKESVYDFHYNLKVYLPILVLGFSGTLYGLATILEKREP